MADWNDALYSCAQAACEEYGGMDAFAADLGVSRQLTALRLKNARDSKGEVQKLRLDDLAHLFLDRAARWRFLVELARVCSALPPEPRRVVTAEEKAQILASAVTEKVRRQLEKDAGLPAGSLG